MKNFAADIDVSSNLIRVHTPSTLTAQENYKSSRAAAVKKKVEFIDFAVKEMNLPNVETVVGRAEDIAKKRKHREKYSMVVSRAVATLPVLLEFALPFCSIGGTFIAMKSFRVQSEIDRSENALNLLGGQIDSVVNVEDKLPFLRGKLVVIRKVAETPDIYPRKAGIPKKRPL